MPTREKRLRLEANKQRREQALRQTSPTPLLPDPAPALPVAEEVPMAIAPDTPCYWARIITPGTDALTLFGQSYDRGELVTLPDDVSMDAAFIRLEFVRQAPADKAYLRAECGACQKWFLNEAFRDQHGAKRHRQRFANDLEIGAGMEGPEGGAALRDITGDAEDRRQWTEYPPNLEKSRATLNG